MYNIHTKTPLKTKDYKSLPYAMPIIRVHSQFCKGPLQIVQTIKPKNHKYQSILLSLGKPHYVYNPVIRSYYNFVRWRQFLEEFNKYQILMDSHEYFLSRLKERNQQLIFGKEDSKKRKSLRWLYKPKREPTKPGIKHDPSFLKILRHSRSKHNSLPSECLT
ncbi:hypothetical protein SNEBB_000356 [Seison nebaliae]|nr:hypothetical protein SNEBB_000356 [Seison nebaliae]